jgi:hypothetical protein
MRDETPDRFEEICENCGFTYGSHLASRTDKFPKDCCPGHEGRMDWEKGPGTTFERNNS